MDIDDRIGVLFVNTKRQPPLGADTWVHLQIMRDLDRTRFDVHAACATGPAGQPTPTYLRLREIPDVIVRPFDLGRELVNTSTLSRVLSVIGLVRVAWNLLALAWYIRRSGISVIHTADRPREAFACVLLARLSGARCVVHMHVGYDARWMRSMLRWAIHHADALIAVSAFVADTLLIDAGCDPAKVHVVLNGIDVDRWVPRADRDEVRTELGLGEATPVVLTVCRLFPSKGTTELVQAIHDVQPNVPDAVLLVVGEEMASGYVADLQALARQLGVAGRVRFLGRRDDVAATMAASDVFAMPSYGEPFGLVYVEAMAMALPVVALASAGALEIVEPGVTGLLPPVGDASALAADLAALLADPSRRKAYGAAGRRRAEQRFTTARMTAAAADVLAQVASTAHGARVRPDGQRGGAR